jgi:glycosyltransferase involved in cell wall biosynthesis
MGTSEQKLRVVLCTAGTFHFFDLARELEARGVLEKIHSSFHWGRLRREALPRGRVRSFPWIHPAYMAMGRFHLPVSRPMSRRIEWINSVCLDNWVAARLPECDVFSALSNNGLRSGAKAQQRGAKYICDRGCSHIRFQENIVREEYDRWGLRWMICDPRTLAREEAEYAEADAIVVPSEFSRQSFLSMGVAGEKIRKIPLGVNLARFYPDGAPDGERFDVLYAGQVSFRKGIPYLLEAFAQFQHPKKKLRIVGAINPEIRDYLAHHLPEQVEVLGSVPQASLRGLMSRSHVLVLPSIEDGFGMVLSQAMACGCPVISTTNTGGSDLYTDGVEGYIVPIRSPEAIREKFEALAGSPELEARMRTAALERVRKLGGWHEYGQSYMDLMRGLVG